MSGMKAFEIKNFGDTQLRVHFDDGTPWFALRDVCKAIAVANIQTAMRYVPEDCKRKLTAKTKTGVRDMLAVNRQGLSTLIERFPSPESVRFDHWLNNGLTGATVQGVDNENAIRVFENPAFGQKIKCYEKDGTVYLNLEAAAKGLGFTHVERNGEETVKWESHGVYRFYWLRIVYTQQWV